MSEIAKCPICQSTMTLYEEHMDGSDAIACNKCSFTCAEKDLPRVTAAMEFAMAVTWSNEARTVINLGVGKVTARQDMMKSSVVAIDAEWDARQRVMEVFGK